MHHSDWVAANDIVASAGSRGGSYGMRSLSSSAGYTWELIYRQRPWRGLEDAEFATLTYVDCFHNQRLHGTITDDPPSPPQ